MGIEPPPDAFGQLCERLGTIFDSIVLARTQAAAKLEALRDLAGNGRGTAPATVPIASPDTSVVVFGSLARREWTVASDVDWTLLVDSAADPLHRQVAREFTRRLTQADLTGPGPAGVFGTISFSHELIHWIGGEQDTNTNMTRRVLLLLESASLGMADAHTRVVRGILKRYLDSERSFLAESGRRYKVPRFLLNDVVRYWRTVAVDYVSKRWERGDEGWALRNIKLRFSRKLLFVSGMLLCFSCYLEEPAQPDHILFKDQEEAAQRVHERLAGKLGKPPLEILCGVLLTRAKPETSQAILRAYDAFLAALNDTDKRKGLACLTAEASYADALFRELRTRSREFEQGLTRLFYEDDVDLRDLILKYGVF